MKWAIDEYTCSDEDWDKIVNDDELTFYYCNKTRQIKTETLEANKRRMDAMTKPHVRRNRPKRVEAFIEREKERERKRALRLRED